MHYLGLCAIAKNEAAYLKEWVAHHYLLGFERFFIYDNESDEPIRETLREYIEKGVVEVENAPGKSMQIPCYNDCLERRRSEIRWLAFFDIDEFLILKRERDARLLLAEYEQYGGLAVHWAPFGSGGHLRRPPGLVLEEYVERVRDSGSLGLHVKSIVRTDAATGMRDAHQALFRKEFHLVNEAGVPVVSALSPHIAERVQLNHYMFKSQQDYEGKIVKGRADVVSLSGSRSWEKFHEQSLWPTRPEQLPATHLRILRLAVKNQTLSRHLDVNTGELDTLHLYQLVERVNERFGRREFEVAELMVESARRRFAAVPEYLFLAVLIGVQLKKFERALKDVCALIYLQPSIESYYQLFLVHVGAQRHDRAREVGRYLVETTRTFRHDAPAMLKKLRETDIRLQLGIF